MNLLNNNAIELFKEVAPKAKELTNSYVNYVCTVQYIENAFVFVLWLSSALGIYFCYKKHVKKEEEGGYEDVPIYQVAIIVLGIMCFLFSIGLIIETYESLLAARCPDMFVLDHIFRKGR